MTKEEVIAKVQKLLRLSQSPNENEAALAAAKAKEFLSQYNLTEIDINEETGKVEFVKEFSVQILVLNEWVDRLSEAVARTYNCRVFVIFANKEIHGDEGTFLVFMGEEANAKIACYMLAYLIKTVDRLAEDAYNEKGLENMWKEMPQDGTWHEVRDFFGILNSQSGKKDKVKWVHSYKVGMTARIIQKLWSEIKSTPAHDALIVYMKDAIDKHVRDRYGTPKKVVKPNENLSEADSAAIQRGYNDGESVGPRLAIEEK